MNVSYKIKNIKKRLNILCLFVSEQIEGTAVATDRIKVSKLPDEATEDGLTLFFENRKRSGGGAVVAVDYDRKNKTAVVIFTDEDGNHNNILGNGLFV